MSVLFSLDFWAYVGIFAGIYMFLAMGLQVQLGYAGIANFGVVGFMAISAYSFAILIVKLQVPLLLAALAALAAAAVAAVLLGPVVVRLREDYLAIATIALSEMVRYTALNWTSLTGGAIGSIGIGGTETFTSYSTGWNDLLEPLVEQLQPSIGVAARNVVMLGIEWVVIAPVLALLVYWLHSPWGRVLEALREDDQATIALGKKVQTYRLQALVIGAVVMGMGGVFYALALSTFSPSDFGANVTIFTYMIIIIGGIGVIRSVPLGALVFAVIYAGTRFFTFPPFSLLADDERAYVRMILIGLVLIAIIWFRPQGLLGKGETVVLK